MSMLPAIVLPWSTVFTHLCAITEVQSPSIYFPVWVIPVIFFSAIIPKERVKSSFCWSVVSLKESKVPLKKENTVIEENNVILKQMLPSALETLKI